MTSSSQAMEIWEPIWIESDTSGPMSSEWLSAEANCSSAFSITTDRPKVTSSVVSTLRSSAAWISVRRQVAVGQVDDLHHAEHQRQPAGEQRVETADQDPLDDRVNPAHAGASR